ncbi:MAG: leucine--tRNA ligase [Prevotellaceae bacterium]|jgi:leucyl-tRNA synthetase|nr:leucine--tRNA ligase [Prevotellaceae bacterium]
MEYNFTKIEQRWQRYWAKNKTFKSEIDHTKAKFYVLDMFPYPSGAGLHVGHPLGYIASDIFSRFKRLKGFNVLHPMGYDAFGLPAEQYAIQTGQHPAVTTALNITRYREQMDKIGFSYDWDREVQTCDPDYYKWTQWAFIEMFHSYYCYDEQQARPISELEEVFAMQGACGINVACSETLTFSAAEWNAMSEQEKQEVLMNYRIAYLGETSVNWCSVLGTVLANDEVKDGFSVRGGHPVEQRMMKQWQLRVSAYAERLLNSLETLAWSDSLKEMQRNWIGKSEGAEMLFKVRNGVEEYDMCIFTTRADTVFGATFMVLAPESEWVEKLTVPEQRAAVEAYLLAAKKKTERERMTETHKASGVSTGSYAINPFTKEQIPVWISEYVLAGYGTGAIMAVPAHDSRDYLFAKQFNLPIVPLIEGCDISSESFDAKEGVMCNSGFLNGLSVQEAIPAAIDEVERLGIGKRKVNYRLRDAIFSRQRYWGEPFPIYYKEGVAVPMPIEALPLALPEVDKYAPTETGEPPLGRSKDWNYQGYPIEKSTMPGFAGSSAYYLRYMDPLNSDALVSREANDYWQDVDLYIGGTEHATGHLIYSRFWNKFLFDRGYVCQDEPFKKLVNQGMIQGRSNFVYRIMNTNTFVSLGLKDQYETTELHVDVNIVENDRLDIEAFKAWRPEFGDAEFVLEEGQYICGWAVEKMSKSMYNVVNPDQICIDYGADTLRMYEMFLGPLEQAKPWDTNGIDGVFRFLKKVWRLFFDKDQFFVHQEAPSAQELKALHKLIQKVENDIEQFSFNTSVSGFMIFVNELMDLKCRKQAILEPFLILLSPFAPHITEELWSLLGHSQSISKATYPKYNQAYTVENIFEYPVSVNGKLRFKKELPLGISADEVEKAILSDDQLDKYLGGATVKKVVVVPGRIVNVVC